MKKTLLIFACLLYVTISQSQTQSFDDGVLHYTIIEDNNVSVKMLNKVCPTESSVVVPETVTHEGRTYIITSLEEWAFYNCKDITDVTIPSSVTKIERAAFRGVSNLSSITIPSSVTTIEGDAFRSCKLLTSVTVSWTTPIVIDPSVFSSVEIANIPLIVPAGTEAAYQAAAVWQDFGTSLSTASFNPSIALQVYPNPAQHIVHINLKGGLVLNQVQLYNTLGQVVKQSKISSIDVSTLSRGLYILEVLTNEGNTTKKIIIE